MIPVVTSVRRAEFRPIVPEQSVAGLEMRIARTVAGFGWFRTFDLGGTGRANLLTRRTVPSIGENIVGFGALF
jgi:hypothetical protein